MGPAEVSLSGESPGFPSDSEPKGWVRGSPGWSETHRRPVFQVQEQTRQSTKRNSLSGQEPRVSWPQLLAGAASLKEGDTQPFTDQIAHAARPDTSGSLSQVGTKLTAQSLLRG